MNIFLADDHPLFRMGLRIALDQEDEMKVIGEASDGFSAVEKIQSNPPDLSLIDVDMPGISGIRAIRILRKALPEMKILVLSTYDDEKYIHEAMLAGADGYLLKCVEVAELVEVIRSVCEGKQVVSPFLVNLAMESYTVRYGRTGRSDRPDSAGKRHIESDRRRSEQQGNIRYSFHRHRNRQEPHQEHLPEAAGKKPG